MDNCVIKEYGYDAEIDKLNLDKTVADTIKCLKEKNLHIATAESCTGGLLAELITSVPGASEVFELGIVSYSNAVKAEYLRVPDEMLDLYTAVSPQVAAAMAEGIVAKSDIAVSVTGYADTAPDGERPGTVYIAISYRNSYKTKTEVFLLKLWEFPEVTRNTVRINAAKFAFREIKRVINEYQCQNLR